MAWVAADECRSWEEIVQSTRAWEKMRVPSTGTSRRQHAGPQDPKGARVRSGATWLHPAGHKGNRNMEATDVPG